MMLFFFALVSIVLLQATMAFSPHPAATSPGFALLARREHLSASPSKNESDRELLMSLFNKQVTRELEASQLYLAASIWFDQVELVGMASYMLDESDEERSHGLQFISFAAKRDIPISLEYLDAPSSNWDSAKDVWKDILENERTNTQSLFDLADAAQACHDHAMLTFLQDFHIEQVNSEDKLNTIIAKVREEVKTPGLLRQLDTELGLEAGSRN